MKKSKLPQTDSIQELSRFWGTHDLTDFDDELVEVSEPVFVCEMPIQVILPPNEADAVQQIAKSLGVTQEDLLRDWVLEKLAGHQGGS